MHQFSTTIERDRFLLRPHTIQDVEPSYQMNLDEGKRRHTGDGGVVSREEIKHRILNHVIGDYNKRWATVGLL